MRTGGNILDDNRGERSVHKVVENDSKQLQLSREDVTYLQQEWDDDVSLIDKGDTQTISVTNTVGVIGLPSGKILSITPKVETSLLYLLAYAGRVNDKIVRDRHPGAIELGDSLTNLLGQLFLTEIEHLHRQGLDQDYRTTESTERHVRGQIQVQKQLQQHGPVPTEFECQYQDRTPNIPINQVLVKTVNVVLPLITDADLRARLQQAQARFKPVVAPSVHPLEALEQISLSRLNDHYRAALLLSQAILEQEYLHDTTESTRPFPSMVFPMPTVFEEVVQQVVETTLDGTPYRMSKKDLGTIAKRADDERGTRDLEPDFVIRREVESKETDPVIAVGDAKWKTDKKPSSEDFYQLATYQAYADVPGILIYPKKQTEEHDLVYENSSDSNRGRLLIRTLNTDPTNRYEPFVDQLFESLRDPLSELLDHTDTPI